MHLGQAYHSHNMPHACAKPADRPARVPPPARDLSQIPVSHVAESSDIYTVQIAM